ncbi:MAG: 3-hydroxylacyl-ACP dehydratase [Burkholderiaceae bacterium]|jgi:predicted hotdog family 3-hydroxylacyl-ACP dehydratase|nr:3-hydroxylacyl-ACP dehydratase [Burkholderiaceae bacterium]
MSALPDVFAAACGQGHAWIAARVPHAGRMCLLDGVTRATPQAIICTACNHRAHDHPLRQDGRLGAACGVEYAAQAMALHGALQAEQRQAARPRAGMLVSLRDVRLQVGRLDDIDADLTVQAKCEADNGDHCVYGFWLSADARPLLQGRAVVMLDVSFPTS